MSPLTMYSAIICALAQRGLANHSSGVKPHDFAAFHSLSVLLYVILLPGAFLSFVPRWRTLKPVHSRVHLRCG